MRRAFTAAAAACAIAFTFLALLHAPATIGATAPAAASSYSVQIANYAYSPSSITVDEGDTITWTNEDTAPHTVTTSSGPQALNSPTLSKGQSWSFTFTKPGTYVYYCAVHPYMRAQVIVRAPAPAPATTRAATSHAATSATHRSQPTHGEHTTRAAVAPVGLPSTKPAAASTAASASPTPSAAAQVQDEQAAATSNIRTLSPVLLLGGLTAAIAVFCLLLVGSRAAVARADPPGDADDS